MLKNDEFNEVLAAPEASASASASDELALELEVRCAKVTARLHFLMAGSDATPLSEYIELSPQAAARSEADSGGVDGWLLKFRSWASSSLGGGGYQVRFCIKKDEFCIKDDEFRINKR